MPTVSLFETGTNLIDKSCIPLLYFYTPLRQTEERTQKKNKRRSLKSAASTKQKAQEQHFKLVAATWSHIHVISVKKTVRCYGFPMIIIKTLHKLAVPKSGYGLN